MSANIESTLAFDTDTRFAHDDRRTLVAEGIHEQGERSVRTTYILEEADEDTLYPDDTLHVRRYYRVDGDLRNQDSGSEWTVCNGRVAHSDQDLRQFVDDNFHGDPEATLGAAFEDMVVLQ